jgi:hypothetical protein
VLGLNPYILGGVAAAFLAALGFAGCQYQRAEKYEARATLAEANTATAIDANQAGQLTIERQARALKQWADLGVTPEKVAAIIDQSSRFKASIDTLAAENNLLRSKDRALPECVALLKISLSQRCPSIAAGLMQLAAGSGQISPRRDPGSGGETTPSGDHERLSTALSVPIR